jgi:signal transduction histidine kinase
MTGMYGLPEEYARGIEQNMQRGYMTFTLEQLEESRPLIRRNVWQTYLAKPNFAHLLRFADQVEWDSTVLIPLVSRGRKLGVLAAYYAAEDVPDSDECAYLAAIGNQAAIAAENERLFVQVQEKASLEERARLSRDLHDSATQTVFSVGMLARAAQLQHQRGSERLGATLERVAALAQQAHAEMRALLFELRPETAVQEGLTQALERLVEAVRTRSGLKIEIRGDVPADLPPAEALALFRIVQEALNNAAKHSGAANVTVDFTADGGQLRVSVVDNGAGFDPHALLGRNQGIAGMGMRSRQERAASAGFGLKVISSPDTGTSVQLLVPMA